MANTDILVYDSLAKSNIPVREKNQITSWIEKVSGLPLAAPRRRAVVDEGISFLNTFRQYSEGSLVGAALGAVHAEFGLDVKGVAVDGTAGVAAGIGSVLLGGSTDLVNIGSHASCVYSFRKIHALRSEMIRAKGGVPRGVAQQGAAMAGESDEDPIVTAAKAMGK